MRLTKHAHACVEIDDGDDHLLLDPGAYTPGVDALIARTDTILVTHEHADHVEVDAIGAALAARADLTVYGPEPVVTRWRDAGDRAVPVVPGDTFCVGALEVEVLGGTHQAVHPDVPGGENVGYLVDGRLLHPGDSFERLDARPEVLLLPVAGPWFSLAGAVDYARAMGAARIVAIHELPASEMGLRLVGMRFGADRLVETPLEVLAPGESILL